MKGFAEQRSINVRGSIREMKPGQSIEFSREQTKPSYVRVVCCNISLDYGYKYSVKKLDNDKFRVTRNA